MIYSHRFINARTLLMNTTFTKSHLFLDIDECSGGSFPCGNNATCTDTDGSFECDCVTGFFGDGFNCTGKYNVVEYLSNFLCITN